MEVSLIAVMLSLLPEVLAEMRATEAFVVAYNKSSILSTARTWLSCQWHCMTLCTDSSFEDTDLTIMNFFLCDSRSTDEISPVILKAVFFTLLFSLFIIAVCVGCCRCCCKKSNSNTRAPIHSDSTAMDMAEVGVVRQGGAEESLVI